jgi:hypothetical protein
MNLSTGRIVIIVGLIVAGLAVLANGFASGSGAVAAPSGSSTPTRTPSGNVSPSDTGSPTVTPSPQTTGVLIMVLNGTDVVGAAGAAQTMLVDAGYKAPKPAADAPVQGVKKTTVYYRDDADAAQNQSDATYMVGKYFKGGLVKPLDTTTASVVPSNVTLVVVVGNDYATKLTQ